MNDGYARKTGWFLLAFTVFRVVYGAGLNALPDEADYFVWSQRPAFSYFCHPPLLMYFLALVHGLVSDKVLVLRLVAALLAAGASGYLFLLARELADSRKAFQVVVLTNITLLFMAGSLIATPDTPMLLFLTGAGFYFHRAVHTGRTAWWLVAGLFTGLALQSKLIAVFILPSFFLYLVLSGHGKWLRYVQPYAALAVAMAIFAPVLVWNAGNEWVTFAFQLDHGFGGGRFPAWKYLADFVLGQMVVVGPILLFLLVGALISVGISWRRRSDAERFLWCLASVPFAFFLLSALQKKVEANWPVFAYVPGIVLVMLWYARSLGAKKWGRLLWQANWVYSVGVLTLLLIHIYAPLLNHPKDRTHEFFGWDRLGAEAVQLAADHPGFRIAANRYQIASELAFYSDLPVVCLNIDSRANQFDLWQDRDALRGRDYLFFDDRSAAKPAVIDSFERFEPLRTIPLWRGDVVIREIQVYRAYHLKW